MVGPRVKTFVKEGDRFGKLTSLVSASGATARILCICDCGNTHTAYAGTLIRAARGLRGGTKSCGCSLRDSKAVKHGCAIKGHEHPLYRTWTSMIGRCYNPENWKYADYGGRGITVCERWRESFANFIADMPPRPEGTTLDRKRNNEGYSPENCRWATQMQQARNRRSNRVVCVLGKSMTFAQAVETYSVVPLSTAESRINRLGWSVLDALTIPSRGK